MRLFPLSLIAACFLVAACGGKVIEGDPENTDGGVGGSSAGMGGSAPGGSAGWAQGGTAGWSQAGSAGWTQAGSAGWQTAGSAGWQAGGSAGWMAQGGSAGMSQGGSTGDIYGMIDQIAFKTPFLLDADKLGDDAYVQQHYDGILFSPGFYGWYTYKHLSIPSGQANETVTYGMHQAAMSGSPPSVIVTQYSMQGDQIADPYVYLSFATDNIKPGMYQVGLSGGVGAYLVLYHFLNGGNDYCAAAVAYGQLSVIAAENTSAPDGGTLAIGGQGIQLFHPTMTPDGDVSSWLGQVCPIQ